MDLWVYRWWLALSIVSSVQVVVALIIWARRRNLGSSLALVYAAVCCFRSFYPRVDAERLCLWDSPLSWPLFGRSAATVAECCLGLLLSIHLHDSRPAILCALANVCCNIAVLTLNQLWHAIEESLWALVALLIFIRHRSAHLWLCFCVPYFLYMITIDIPTYIRRYQFYSGPILTISLGFQTTAQCAIVTGDLAVWGPEMWWMTPYFTFAVWAAIWMGSSSKSISKSISKSKFP